jgi:hypothetical protein
LKYAPFLLLIVTDVSEGFSASIFKVKGECKVFRYKPEVAVGVPGG